LKKCKRIVELLLPQRFNAMESEIFRLRQARPELMQCVQIVQLLFRRAGFALSAQSDTQTVVRLFEIRLQLDCSPERCGCAGYVAAGFELHAQVILCLWILGIEFDSFAELGEGARVIALTAQRHSQQRVRPRELGIKSEGAAKLSRSAIQIAELSLGQPQF